MISIGTSSKKPRICGTKRGSGAAVLRHATNSCAVMRSGRGALIWDNATASACCMIHTDGRLIPVIYEPGEAGAPDPEVFVRVARTSRRLTRRSSRRADRTEDRRVGKECGGRCRLRGAQVI